MKISDATPAVEGDTPDDDLRAELTPERIEAVAAAVNAAWPKQDLFVRQRRCQQAAITLRRLATMLATPEQPGSATPSAPVGVDESDIRWLLDEVRHGPLDHDYIKDEKRCGRCKRLAKITAALAGKAQEEPNG